MPLPLWEFEELPLAVSLKESFALPPILGEFDMLPIAMILNEWFALPVALGEETLDCLLSLWLGVGELLIAALKDAVTEDVRLLTGDPETVTEFV